MPNTSPPESAERHDAPFQIGRLAQASGKSVRALHLYESLGLMTPLARSRGNFRLYSSGSVQRVRWIEKLHALGMSLPQIRAFLEEIASKENGPAGMAVARAAFERTLIETRAARERLALLEAELVDGLAYLDGCRGCSPARPLSMCATCELPHSSSVQPAIVAGLHEV